MNMQGNLGRNIPQPQGMPQGMSQGIASLGGMSPSPRAGIGNVQDRVDAFRQNPQALQTPPNVPPDLLDALALQKIMSEKEAVKREMAMAQPGQQPTIMQQLEQKALGDTKQEIAQQVGGVAQKQEQDKQQAMQRLMSGIAQAPGAGQVMPARMAGGGIVAFQNRGEVPPTVDPREVQRILRKSPMARTTEENEILRQSGIQLEQRRMGPEGIIQRAERGLQQIGPAARQYLTEGAAGLSPEELEQRSDTGAITEKLYRMLGGQQTKPPASGMSEADLQDLMPTRQPLPQTPLPPEMGLEEPPQAPPSVARPGLRGAAVKPPGIAGALEKPVLPPDSAGQGISPPALTARPELEAPFTKAAQGILSRDPEAMARAAQERFGAAMDPAEAERRKVLDQIIGQQRASLEGMPDARERNLQRLFAGLRNVGTGGRSGLGGFAEASQAQARGYQQQQQKYQEELNKFLMGEANRGVDVAGKRYGVGEEARAGVGADIRAAMSPVGSVVSSQLGAQSGAADRISREAIAKMDDRTRRFVADLQARTRQGGELNPDDLARIRANATKAVEESLMKDGRYLTLKQKDPAAAEQQKQEAIEKMSQDLVKYARSGGATAAPAAPAAGQKVIDFASIGAK